MKRIVCYLVCLLIWGCSSSPEEYGKELESGSQTDAMEHFLIIDDSVANYLFKDPFFINLCEQLNVRQFLENKNSKQIADSTIIDYRDLFKRLFILGDSLKIPNILRYRTEYYQIKYSENILT